MSTLSQFVGGRGGIKPTGLINGDGGVSLVSSRANETFNTAAGSWKSVLSGASTANVLQTVLSLSGKGTLSFFAAGRKVGGVTNQRLKVTIDGVVVIDGTVTTPDSQHMALAVGHINPAYDANFFYTGDIIPEPLNFDTSLLLEYAQSTTETDAAYWFYKYIPR